MERLCYCDSPSPFLCLLSFRASKSLQKRPGPLIHSPEEPGPPTLSTVSFNLALFPWGWPCCSVFSPTDLEAKPRHLRSPAPWVVASSRWLLTSGLSTENHQMAFYKKIRTKTVFTLQGKLKVTNTNLNCIRTWVHSRNSVFEAIFHSYTQCLQMPQATAANGPLEDREGNWTGSVTLGFSQAQGGGAAGRQDGGLCTEGAQAPPPPSSALIFPLSGSSFRGWCQWKMTPPCMPVIAASLQIRAELDWNCQSSNRKEKKNNKSFSIQALWGLLGVSKPYPGGSRDLGNSLIMWLEHKTLCLCYAPISSRTENGWSLRFRMSARHHTVLHKIKCSWWDLYFYR